MAETVDMIDAVTVAKRVGAWNGGGIMEHSTLLYQMGGKPGVDPYGWRAQRIETAIEAALTLKLIELYPSVGGTTYRYRGID